MISVGIISPINSNLKTWLLFWWMWITL